MNTIFDLNPWTLFDELLGSDMPFRAAVRNARNRAEGRFPPVNVFVDDDAALVEAELPGYTAAKIDLTLDPEAVTIAEKPDQPAEKDAPKPAPAWTRRIELPFRVDADKASAKFENGILKISLPKVDARTARRIHIENA
ncbi:MAG: Hsp20/alpha crystallin family protein [Kiritimatiellae bacterium]|nr:Hsp20/alpha crystallin family protein [Kiritimatiellia bacterium]